MRDEQNRLVTDLIAPDRAPSSVTDEYEIYQSMVDRLDEAHRAKIEAENAVFEAAAADAQATAQAMREGTVATNTGKRQGKAREALRAVERQLEATEIAVDEAGDAFLQSIETAREKWLGELREEIAEAKRTYAKAIADSRAAAEALIVGRHTADWLDTFEAWKFERGRSINQRTLRYVEPHALRLAVRTAGIPAGDLIDGSTNAMPLLDALAGAVEPEGAAA